MKFMHLERLFPRRVPSPIPNAGEFILCVLPPDASVPPGWTLARRDEKMLAVYRIATGTDDPAPPHGARAMYIIRQFLKAGENHDA